MSVTVLYLAGTVYIGYQYHVGTKTNRPAIASLTGNIINFKVLTPTDYNNDND